MGDIEFGVKPCFMIADAYGLHVGCFCSLSVVVYLSNVAADQVGLVSTFLSAETKHESNDE